MGKELTEVLCGYGRGKTALAIGQSIRAATQGKSAIIIQFLKGRERRALDFLQDLDNLDIRIFRFEKHMRSFEDLNEQEREEESSNIVNAMNYARKVIATGGCDFLVLDEILGIIEYGIVSVEAIVDVLKMKEDSMHIVMTGRVLPDGLLPYVDSVTTLTTNDLTDEVKKSTITED